MIKRHHHFHRPERADQHTAFTADTFFLIQFDYIVRHIQGIHRAGSGTGGVFALAAGDSEAVTLFEHDTDTGGVITAVMWPVVIIMRDNAGNFAGVTSDTFLAVRNYTFVHVHLSLSSFQCW